MKPSTYEWTTRDKRRYVLALLPFGIAVVITAIVLTSIQVWLFFAWAGLYLLVNLFQAGCCVGCPYRGRYCPAILGIYLSNWLSRTIYPDRDFDPTFFQRNATVAEFALIIFVVFPLRWLWSAGWGFAAVYLLMLASHFVMFMPTQCEHCSYNETCPGGRTWIKCRQVLRR
jgi:hypothetical protein